MAWAVLRWRRPWPRTVGTSYWLKASVTLLEARVSGLEYELRQRDLRVRDLEEQNATLRKRLEEQAPPPPPFPPPFVKPNKPPGRV